jgi:hypothetical protein
MRRGPVASPAFSGRKAFSAGLVEVGALVKFLPPHLEGKQGEGLDMSHPPDHVQTRSGLEYSHPSDLVFVRYKYD